MYMDQLIQKKPLTDKLPKGGQINQYGGRRRTRKKRKRKKSRRRGTRRKGGDVMGSIGSVYTKGKISMLERKIKNLKSKYRKLDPKSEFASRKNVSEQAKKAQLEIDHLKNPQLKKKEVYGKRRRALSKEGLMSSVSIVNKDVKRVSIEKKWTDLLSLVDRILSDTSHELVNEVTILQKIKNYLDGNFEKRNLITFNDFLKSQERYKANKPEIVQKRYQKIIDTFKVKLDGNGAPESDKSPKWIGWTSEDDITNLGVGGGKKRRRKTRRKKRTKKKTRRRRRRKR